MQTGYTTTYGYEMHRMRTGMMCTEYWGDRGKYCTAYAYEMQRTELLAGCSWIVWKISRKQMQLYQLLCATLALQLLEWDQIVETTRP